MSRSPLARQLGSPEATGVGVEVTATLRNPDRRAASARFPVAVTMEEHVGRRGGGPQESYREVWIPQGSPGLVAGLERHQVAVYVAALAAGAAVGLAGPATGPVLEHAINPVLAPCCM